MSSSDMFDIFIQYADVCSMHRKSLEMKDSTSLSIHLLTRSVSPCLTMSLLDRHIDIPWHILTSHPPILMDFTPWSKDITGLIQASVDFIWLRLRDLRGLCGGLGTMENCCSIESPQPVQSRYVSLCCTFAAGLLISGNLPRLPLPSPAIPCLCAQHFPLRHPSNSALRCQWPPRTEKSWNLAPGSSPWVRWVSSLLVANGFKMLQN